MAGEKFTIEANRYLNLVYGSESPATLVIKLYNTLPTGDDPSTAVEVSGTGYTALTVNNNTTTWPTSTNKVISNGIILDWGTVGAGGWGTLNGFGIFNGDTGDGIHWGTFDTPVSATVGLPIQIAVGNLTVQEQ